MEYVPDMSELQGIYKLTEQCSVDFSLHAVICDGVPKELSRRESTALQVLTDAALHRRVATFQEFGNALWPESGWDDARRQALKDIIHDLRGNIGDIIRARSSVGYTLTVTPVPQDDKPCGSGVAITDFDPSPYAEFLDRIASNASRMAVVLEDFERVSKELHTNDSLSEVFSSHLMVRRRKKSLPESATKQPSSNLRNTAANTEISSFEQEVAQLDYIAGEIRNTLQALQAASSRIKQKMQLLNDLGHSHDESESLPAQRNMVRFHSESQMLDDAYTQIAASIESEIISCEYILLRLREAISSKRFAQVEITRYPPMHQRSHGLGYRARRDYRYIGILGSSIRHLSAIHEGIRSLSALYESEDSLLEMPPTESGQQ